MSVQEPWRNPDITLSDLAERLGTNRTTLSAEIHAHSYAHLSDYIAFYRITALCRVLDKSGAGNMDEAFFEVGYRSLSTALDNFKKQTGYTPGQYLKLNPEEKIILRKALKR